MVNKLSILYLLESLQKALTYVLSLSFEEEPDYDYLIQLFSIELESSIVASKV